MRVAAVAGGDAVLDQGAAGAVQLLHGVEGRADDGPHRRLEERREAGEHRRVDGIGLGMPADRFGEATGLAGIDLDQRQAGLGQAALEGAVIGAAGLERDAGDRRSRLSQAIRAAQPLASLANRRTLPAGWR